MVRPFSNLLLLTTFLLIILCPSFTFDFFFSSTDESKSYLTPKSSSMGNNQIYSYQEGRKRGMSSKIIQLWNESLLEEDMNVSFFGNAFEGYNLFILRLRKFSDENFRQHVLFITDMNGQLIIQRFFNLSYFDRGSTKFINSTTIQLPGPDGLTLWNIYKNSTKKLSFQSHHEYEYNPINNTFYVTTNPFSLNLIFLIAHNIQYEEKKLE